MNKAAQALGRMGKGVPKRLSKRERNRRKLAMLAYHKRKKEEAENV